MRHYVEVTLKPEEDDRLVECLRYSGVISRGNAEHVILINCPAGIGRPAVWAEMNAERIRAFGFKATASRART